MLRIGTYEFSSRLLLGTGKFPDFHVQRRAVEVSETEILTFAVRRMNIYDPAQPNFLEQLDLQKYKLLPNTAGASTAEEAVRIARLARASGLCDMIKVEVIADMKTLLPDPIATLEATKILVEDGFTVLPYTNDDPVLARHLQEAGAHAVMPGASPIGSGQGILNPLNLGIIIEEATVPIIIDAGIGTASDVAIAMELGADGVLLNTAVSGAKDPVKMAEAMMLGIKAGRLAYEAGRIPKKRYAQASSPVEGISK
ncbi:thiazole synthase [Aneurinibacillus aneurinilyticus]|jgi:thiazole synthase|uniref:Thiazole synthase n=2 Tax=Aneurinibacillus aneurinilyticus TaxID=1391 RepID=A0A848CPP1_ANEAE|nr:thiazole synthase [Aneurinibacillus aneurinilyticus]ERI08404.1 thiazole biosynthesis protein ThiG [Aneurinibacillus aneurinilyticus ATCC 12856]MCI1695147.1 thiazole synthase [Aneurinibacillus aneurinilyticus]MED0671811.1 thiazole synthase [Aneurinibacillus aneurinilyticus]MED0704591.1 thiazole synthase [Aneurinibacillus aneurinilyticus]MED0725198.1 thiazole synthase [Aneurinibacillus aneurinilyticus]